MLLVVAAAALPACSSNTSTPSGPTSPAVTPTPTPVVQPTPTPVALTATVSITGSGFTPSEVTIAVGGRVRFVNTDARPHDMLGGPDHTRLDCPQVDVVGFLSPGQSKETATFQEARLCEFHDHTNLGNPAFQGRIVVR